MRDIRSNKKINIQKNNPASIGKFKQRSNATLILDLYDEFSNYVDLTNQEISIRVERPDGLHFEQVNNITKNSNILTVKLKNEVLEVVGKCRAEINLKDSEGQMNTSNFFFEVVESVLNDDIVFSSEDYESLEKALVVFRNESNALMKKLDDNEKVRISNENTRKSQENLRVNAENNRVSKENERINQENTRKNQEETRKHNETTRQNQESVRQGDENTRKSQENNRVSKENERINQENTRKTNESDRQTRFTKLESDGRRLIAEMNTAIDETITREVTEARGTKAKLGLRLDDMEQQLVENTNRIEQLEDLTPVWQEHECVGNITVNDSFDGITKDLVVRGRTLKNICYNPNTTLNSPNSRVIIARPEDLKPNTDYTVIGFFSEYNFVASDASGYGVIYNNQLDKSCFQNKGYTNFKDRYVVLKLRTKSDFSNATYGLSIDTPINILSGTARVKTILLEGDCTNNPPTEYFNSITSSGELENNKIIIKSIGKNLIDINSFVPGEFNSSTGEEISSSNRKRSGFIKAKSNMGYILNLESELYNCIYEYDSNKNFIKRSSANTSKPRVITTATNTKYIRIVLDKLVAKPILSEGTKATNYEQYREGIKEFTLPFDGGLKSLPNGIRDEIKHNKIIQKIGKKFLNGSENWILDGANTNTLRFTLQVDTAKPNSNGDYNSLTNNFKWMPSYSVDEENFVISPFTTKLFALTILKSRLETPDVNGIKKWLQQNQTTVIYELENKIIHDIDTIEINTFDTTTHITQENNILSDISFKAKVSLSSQSKRLTEENNVLKESSIKTTEEQEVQDQKITTTMLANTELFEMMLNFMPVQLDSKQFRGGEMNMVEVYVTLIIQGDKTLEQVPTIIKPQVEAKLRLLGVIA